MRTERARQIAIQAKNRQEEMWFRNRIEELVCAIHERDVVIAHVRERASRDNAARLALALRNMADAIDGGQPTPRIRMCGPEEVRGDAT